LVQAISKAYRSIAAQTRGVSAHSALRCNIPKVLADEHGVSKATRLAHPAAKHGAWGICPRGGLGSAWGPPCFSLRCSETCAQLIIHSLVPLHANKPQAWHQRARLRCLMRVLCNMFRPLASTSFALPHCDSIPRQPPAAPTGHLATLDKASSVENVGSFRACHFCKRCPGHQHHTSVWKDCAVLGRPVHPSLRARSGIPRPPPQPL
jgi:hypothetical protein